MPVLLGLLGVFGLLLLLTKTGGPKLDPNLPTQTKTAVTFAYFFERDPSKLRAFAKALLPTYPLAAKALTFKATNLQKNVAVPQNPSIPGTSSKGKIAQTRAAGVSTGGPFDWVGDAIQAGEKAAGAIIDATTHPADTASGAWHIITHPSDSISDFANAMVDALHAIPGMDEAGELLKDFAKTDIGKVVVGAFTTFAYYAMAPYLGAQMAAIAFAIPGSIKAEPFTQSWIVETIDRTIRTVNALLGTQFKEIAGQVNAQVEEALAQNPEAQALLKKFSEEVGQGGKAIEDKLGFFADKTVAGIQQKLKETYGSPPDFSKFAKDAGGIREDNAAAAYDLLAKTHYQASTQWDPYTGEDILAHLAKARLQTADKLNPQASVSVYQDPRTLNVQQISMKRVQSLNALLNPPERQKWVDYYVNRARYADSGVKARGSVPSSGLTTATGALPSSRIPPQAGFATMLQPGDHYAILATTPVVMRQLTGGFREHLLSRLLRAQGVQILHLENRWNEGRIYLTLRTPYFVRLRNLPQVRWTNVQKVG